MSDGSTALWSHPEDLKVTRGTLYSIINSSLLSFPPLISRELARRLQSCKQQLGGPSWMTSNQSELYILKRKWGNLDSGRERFHSLKNVSASGKRYLVNLIFNNPPLDTVYSWSIKNCETVSHYLHDYRLSHSSGFQVQIRTCLCTLNQSNHNQIW